VFGAVAHVFTGGRRDVSTPQMLAANRYALTVDAESTGRALQLLSRLGSKPDRV
jgi:hypothetical protein